MIFIRYFSIIKKTLTTDIGLVSYTLEVHCFPLQLADLLYYWLVDVSIECNCEEASQNIANDPLPACLDHHCVPVDCSIDSYCDGDCGIDEEASEWGE